MADSVAGTCCNLFPGVQYRTLPPSPKPERHFWLVKPLVIG